MRKRHEPVGMSKWNLDGSVTMRSIEAQGVSSQRAIGGTEQSKSAIWG